MIFKVFGIYDSKTQAYLPPFMMQHIGDAERALIEHVNDPQHNFSKWAEDFTLFELGTWNNSTGKYDLYEAPKSISVLLHYKRPTVPAGIPA